MKKRLAAGITAIVLALGLAVAGYCYISKESRELTLYVEEALETQGEALFDQAHLAVEQWEKREKFFSAILKHNDADELQKLYDMLDKYASQRNGEMTDYYLKKCLTELKVMLEGEKPIIENIF